MLVVDEDIIDAIFTTALVLGKAADFVRRHLPFATITSLSVVASIQRRSRICGRVEASSRSMTILEASVLWRGEHDTLAVLRGCRW